MDTVGQLINDLFQTHRKPDGKEYTHKEIFLATGGAIDPSYLSRLRHDKIPNPGRETLLALCRVFKVPPSYFFPELEHLAEGAPEPTTPQLQFRLALRASRLQPDVQEKLEQLFRALQGEDK
ncbi:MAG: helix-turn-helix transcriptional regulator [Herpetosiphonaceae bacterium]|nr:helix-turn-helix transcriptional regulator [Herpetosiphonaceae bacterium]